MLLTIFTPAYNRADKLEYLYKSLKDQLNDKYEWLIIDDGSTDQTEEVVSRFMKEAFIQIRYIKKENGGKHTAHNLAVDLARGELFMCLDSDDYLNENAVNKLIETIQKCHLGEGVIAYKCDRNNKLLSDKFPMVNEVPNTYILEKRYKCRGEFVLVYPTELLRKNKFPVFEGEKFLTESVLYDRLKCSMRLLPQVIEICEYQEDGLSNNLNNIMKNNPAGYCLYFMQRIEMQDSIVKRIVTIGKYHCFSSMAGNQKSKYIGKYKMLVYLFKPLGLVFNVYYKKVRGF